MHRSARFLYPAVVLFAASTVLSGQRTNSPTPPAIQYGKPSTMPPGDSTPPTDSLPPLQTIKATAQLVTVDVVVTDKQQNPIHGLKLSDFTLSDNGAPQQISGFQEHTAPPVGQKIPPMRPLPAGIFTNYTPVQTDGPINVLLLDALNTQMKDQSYVRSQLLEFVKNTPIGTRMAIFVLNDRLIMLQGVTSDLTLLKAVLERTTPNGSLILGDSTGDNDNVGNGGTKPASETLAEIGGADSAVLGAELKQAEAVLAADDTQNRALQTLQAMNELSHYLGGIPGRKNLIWFSGSFPLSIFPDATISHPFAVVSNMDEEYRQTANLLARSQVAVYPIDARGLKVLTTSIAKDTYVVRNPGSAAASAQSKLIQDNANENATMLQMAADTGGQAFINTNALSEAVSRSIQNGSNYYTLFYTPSEYKPDGRFHKIQVKLERSGATLSHRAGYFTDLPPSTPTKSVFVVDLAGTGYGRGSQAMPAAGSPNSLTRTMIHGAPDATEILLKLQVAPATSAVESTPFKGNIINPDKAKGKIKGPYRRFAIDVAADARDIKITPTPDGRYQFSTELLTYVYDAAGAVINIAAQKAQGNLSISNYANLRRVGLQFHQEISVPVAGEYYLRTSLRDLETDRYGSVEIPVASVANRPPRTAAATAAPAAAPR